MSAGLPEDETLLSKIQQGNHGAYSTLVKKYYMSYYRLAYRYIGSREDAEDLTQTAFLKLWQNPGAWNDGKGSKFTTWFYRVVINLCLDRSRKKKSYSLEDDHTLMDESDDQENTLHKKQLQLVLKKHIIALPERQKIALILCFYQNLAHKEAADIMKVSEKALQSLLMRAKTSLKKNMAKYDL